MGAMFVYDHEHDDQSTIHRMYELELIDKSIDCSYCVDILFYIGV
jgi:hypothetical protein